ncbi:MULTISPECIES: effector-associated constant component EACC1 [unclassified Streptomyces]|uniref:effector-associated constant component EACC1 n=1 Tax=unclassified Streptomyces TaxID=2593676 RepID=UPI00367BC23A
MRHDVSVRSGWTGDVVNVLLVLASDPELDSETTERLMRRLRSEITELDVASVRPGPAAAAPDGAKGSDAVTIGAIVVALSASGGVFTALVEVLRDWLGRSSARHRISLTIDGDTIELERASDSERRDLIDAYIRRHTDHTDS